MISGGRRLSLNIFFCIIGKIANLMLNIEDDNNWGFGFCRSLVGKL